MLDRLRGFWARAGELLQRRRIGLELDEEFRFHLDAEIEHNMTRGMTPEEARRAALIAFGGVTRFREETRAARGFVGLEAFVRDVRHAVRRMGRAPAFTTGVVGTLAIALGAATGIGALVYGVLLKPLPYPDADRLVHVAAHTPGLDVNTTEHSAGTFIYLLEEARSFSALGGYVLNEGVTITDDDPERVVGANITANLFDVLGLVPATGRFPRAEDAQADTSSVVISHALWQRRFGGDPDIAGKTIELNRRRRVILGVLPATTEAPWDRVSVYFPRDWSSGATGAGFNSRHITAIGRLAAGVTVAQVDQELQLLGSRLRDRFPQLSAEQMRESGFHMTAQPLRDAVVAPVRGELRLLAIMVGVLLLIAVANVVTLVLLRAERLRGEIAVSRALGAPQVAIMRRFVVEGGLLALAGTAVALPLAMLALAVRFGFTDAEIPRLSDIAVTPAIGAGLVAAALGIGVLLGLVSAVRADSGETARMLRDDGRTTRGRQWRRVQAGLVVVQVAFALALLLGAGLIGSSLWRLQRVNLGFDATDRTTFSLFVPGNPYRTWQQITGFHARVEAALRTKPGIIGATTVMQLPSTVHQLYWHPRLETTLPDGRSAQALVTVNVVSPTFFETMAIPLRSGRAFEPTDIVSAAPGVILSASLARTLFGDGNPTGREVRVVSNAGYPPFRVVGVSGDVYAERVVDGVLSVIYFPMVPQLPEGVEMPEAPAGVSFVVRSSLPLDQLAPLFRETVASIDPRVPLWSIRTLDSIVADTMARTRLTMLLLGVAALATLLLSAIGLYSVVAYAVAARTREFAVRLALGATPTSVIRLVLRDGAVVTGGGVLLGIALAFAGTRLLQSMLYEVSSTDARLYVAAVIVVLLVTGVAMGIPARRASVADPAGALRAE